MGLMGRFSRPSFRTFYGKLHIGNQWYGAREIAASTEQTIDRCSIASIVDATVRAVMSRREKMRDQQSQELSSLGIARVELFEKPRGYDFKIISLEGSYW
jgi:hypothetical protein